MPQNTGVILGLLCCIFKLNRVVQGHAAFGSAKLCSTDDSCDIR